MNTGYANRPVLIVDDEEHILLGFDTALRMGGFSNILCVSNPLDALSIINEHQPEVIILDLLMPQLPGQKLLQQIIGTSPELPVLVVTCIDDMTTAVNSVKNGAFDYLVKPVDRALLVSAVEQAFSAREAGWRASWSTGQGQSPLPTIREATDAVINEAMRRSDNNQSAAAKLLGITQPALSQRMKRRRNDQQTKEEPEHPGGRN